MMNTNNEHFTVSCSEVTSLWDDEIPDEMSEKEKQAVSRHLEDCQDCREFVQFTSSLVKLPIDLEKAELNAGVNAAIKIDNERRRLRRMRISQWFAMATAAGLLFVIATFLLNTNSPEEENISVFRCAASQPKEIVEGVFLSYCNNDEPGVLIENGGDVTVSLREGTIGLFIDPHRMHKHPVRVDAPHGKVFVKGTIFTVQAAPENTWVEVFRGIVEIETAATSTTLYVPADRGAELATGNRFLITAPRAEVLPKKLLKLAAMVEMDSKIADKNSAQTGEAIVPLHAVNNNSPSAQIEMVSPSVSSHSTITRKPNSTRVSPQESIYALTKNAQACLLNRDWACAAEHYRTVLKAYPNHPESMAVLISLAKIELRSLQSPKAALTHYEAYLKRDANGPLAEEAYFGIAESYKRLGNTAKELNSLRDFIKRYPNSSLLSNAQNRLEKLEQ